MIDFAQAVYDHYGKDIRRYPCYTNRASGLGYCVPELGGCVRRGVYERTHWDQKELIDGRVKLIFEEGHRQEQHVLADLAAAGVEIIEQQSAFVWQDYELSGHIDGVFLDNGEAVPVEIKSMNPNIFANMHSLEDFDKKPWTRAYKAQITVYMLMKDIDRGIFVLKDKSNGTLRQINVTLDYDLGEACLKTCEQINKHIAANTLPDRIDDRQTCGKCPFKHVCLPNVRLGPELRIDDDPAFESRIDRYQELCEAAKECKALWETIKTEAKAQAGDGGELNLALSRWHLTSKLDSRGGFWLTIKPVGAGDDS